MEILEEFIDYNSKASFILFAAYLHVIGHEVHSILHFFQDDAMAMHFLKRKAHVFFQDADGSSEVASGGISVIGFRLRWHVGETRA